MLRSLFDELGGLDERFNSPEGDLVNVDLYRRVLVFQGVQLVISLGGQIPSGHGVIRSVVQNLSWMLTQGSGPATAPSRRASI